jgi:uncharacterized HhH-GPD family protein
VDYSELEGGLRRMLDRLQTEGTLTKDPDADQYLRENGNALLIGLLLDQRVLAETAFIGPLKLTQRLGHFDMRKIAEMDGEEFREVFGQQPAVHRFTSTMADRVQQVARIVADQYAGDAANMWNDGADMPEIERRVKALPGFGPLKAKKIKYCLHYMGHRA